MPPYLGGELWFQLFDETIFVTFFEQLTRFFDLEDWENGNFEFWKIVHICLSRQRNGFLKKSFKNILKEAKLRVILDYIKNRSTFNHDSTFIYDF